MKKEPKLFIEWYNNLLYDKNVFDKLINEEVVTESKDLLSLLESKYNNINLQKLNEAQLEYELISPILKQLGWLAQPQIVEAVQGLTKKPDWALFLSDIKVEEFNNLKSQDGKLQNQLDCISVLLEAKSFNVDLDKSSKVELAPHFQLMQYLQMYRKQYGFLTNGRFWRFYDVKELSKTKAYIEIDIEEVLSLSEKQEQLKALTLFHRLFARSSYEKNETSLHTKVEQLAINANEYATEAEENLKAVIYGTDGEDSMFELIGNSIYDKSPKAELNQIYDNSIILLFRLLFIVYFEDKNKELLAKHKYYFDYSLQSIFEVVSNTVNSEKFDGFVKLNNLFKILDEGEENFDIPLFNGGLFDTERAPLLKLPKIFTNNTLKIIFEQLLYKVKLKTTLFEHRRDFKNMSVTHLGRIYEGLLEFSFQIPKNSLTYLVYKNVKGEIVEAYYDDYDLAEIRNQKNFVEISAKRINKGDFILKNANNSRKSSASYYTPSNLTQFLVRRGIDNAIAKKKPIQDIKIIDNACGSGHFLVESLNYLTFLGMTKLHEEKELQKIINDERKKINEQIKSLNIEGYELKDEQILKRALLKRCIFGVDLNPFAVELARLSLWIDSFIFGTPLSFIEHRIQHGNALMGSTEKEFYKLHQKHYELNKNQTLTFEETVDVVFTELAEASTTLSNLQDTSSADIKHSKEIYQNTIKPRLEQLSRSLSLISMLEIMRIEGEIISDKLFQQKEKLLMDVFFGIKPDTKDYKKKKQLDELFAEISKYQKRFNFFHYEVAFPEASGGFDVVVGNPPWDKTKFADTDFFPYYSSRYRSMNNSEKQKTRDNLLADPYINSEYENRIKESELINTYLKNNYPKNSGVGDGNLFRFFVEKNLSLLADGGSLNYVLPSALMFEEGSQKLRQYIINNHKTPFFYSFENREGVFPDVDSRYKFAMMQVVKAQPTSTDCISTAFYLTNSETIENKSKLISYPIKLLKELSPQQWAMMEFRGKDDLAILQSCYKRFKPLTESWLDFRRELDMTNDKDLFIERHKEGLLPLFEGKMIWQFSDKLAPAKYWLKKDDFDKRLYSKEIHRMAQDTLLTRPECETRYSEKVKFDREYFRLAFRAIARDTDERTLIFSLLPKNCGAGNSLYTSIPKNYDLDKNSRVIVCEKSIKQILFAQSWFNSLPVDWIARFMIQINVNKTYLYRLPIPQPTDEEILRNKEFQTLAKNSLLLSLADNWQDFAELTSLFDISKDDLPNTEKSRDLLRFNNDKIVAKLYGITDDQLRYILESFPVMKNKRAGYCALFAK